MKFSNQGRGLPARDLYGEGGLGHVRHHIDGADQGEETFSAWNYARKINQVGVIFLPITLPEENADKNRR